MFKVLAFLILIPINQGHLTMTSIEHISGTDSIKVAIRFNYYIFLRDYQQTVNDDIGLEVLSKYNPFPYDMANNYINSKVAVITNKELLLGKLTKLEVVNDDIILNLKYRLKHKVKKITIRNMLLTGLFSDVENLVIVRINSIEKEVKLTQGHNEETFNLN